MTGHEPEILTLEIPPLKGFVEVARLIVAGLAARMDFTYDATEDLKIAVEEACSTAAELLGNRVVVDFLVYHDRLEICLRGFPESVWSQNQRQLILKAVTDEAKLEVSHDQCDLFLVKYRQKKTA